MHLDGFGKFAVIFLPLLKKQTNKQTHLAISQKYVLFVNNLTI